MTVLIGPGGVFNPRYAILLGSTTPTPTPTPAPTFGTMLATFAGAAGSAPVGVVAASGSLPTLDGAGHLPLSASSPNVWLPALARDGLYTVTLSAPSLLSFLLRSNAISGSPSGYYTDGSQLYKMAGGAYAGTLASGGTSGTSAALSLVWTVSLNGSVLILANADGLSTTGTDSTYSADGYLAFRTQAQPALVVSVLYQTFAQADAAYLAAHPAGMTITGVG